MADLDEIMSGREPASGQQEPAPQEPQNAPQEPAQAPPGQEPPPETQDDADPVAGLRKALDEERGKRRKYKDELATANQRLETLQSQFSGYLQAVQAQRQQAPQAPPQPAPDFWENPDAAFDFRLQQALQQRVAPVQQELANTREGFSRMMAADKHGEETVQAAYQALQQRIASNPAAAEPEWRRIMASPHPYGALVQWHKQQSVLTEVGDDPAAYRERLKAELLAELQAQPAQHAPHHPGGAPQQMPSNFAQARSAGPRTTPGTVGPLPLSEIMKR